MDLNEESPRPGRYPVRVRKRTDFVCVVFSVPVMVMVVILFTLTVSYGMTFSFLHPAETTGFRCGINNKQFHSGMNDNTNLAYLGADGKCLAKCPGSSLFYYCLPNTTAALKKAPISLKVWYDASRYVWFGLAMIIAAVLIAFPLCLCFGKLAVFLSHASTILVVGFEIILTIVFLYFKWYYLASYLLMTILFYVVFSFFVKRRVHVIAPLMTASFSFLKKHKTLFFVPFIIILVTAVVACVAGFGTLMSLGLGTPDSQNGYRLVKHKSLSATTLIFPLMGVWVSEFFVAWIRTAVSLIIASSYFQQEIPNLWTALSELMHFHAGTFFFGSFAVFLLENISLLFQFIRSTMSRTQNMFVKFLCKCVMMCAFCLIQFVGEINRLSFVFTAMKGMSFWAGCKHAAKTLKIDTLFSIDMLLHNVFFSVRIIITFAVAVLTFGYAERLELLLPWIPLAAIPTTVYLALSAIDVTIGTTSETILMCLCEDAKDEGIYAPKDLQVVLEWLKEKVTNNVFDA